MNFFNAVDIKNCVSYKRVSKSHINHVGQNPGDRRMNRIKLSPLAARPVEQPEDPSQTKLPVGLKDNHQSDFFSLEPGHPSLSDACLFVPLHYEKNYQYPLIVWLHSNGDDTRQLHRVMPQISLQNFVAVAPRAALGEQHAGFYWEQDVASIDYAADAVLSAIDFARARTNISSERIFVAGYGAAGTMAFRVALTHPDLFAGVASLNGPLPEGTTPLGRWSCSRHLEVLWAHCRRSTEFDQELLCRQLKLLHVAGFSVTLRQYPGGDQLINTSLVDFNRWIMQMIDTTIS
jgi:phospholipase/carboxylesterase